MGNIVNGFKLIGSDEPKVLILGQFPGWDSIRAAQKQNKEEAYYSNSQNIFWHTIECIVGPRKDNESNNEYLSRNRIALWDSIAIAELRSDTSCKVKNAIEYNKLVSFIKSKKSLKCVFINGSSCEKDFKKAIASELNVKVKDPSLYIDIPYVVLYSTSGFRKCYCSDEEAIDQWIREIKKYL